MKIKNDSPSIFTCYRDCSFEGNSDWNLPKIHKEVDEFNRLLPRERLLKLPAYGGNCFCYHDNLSAWVYLPRDVDVL
jgi:hypothetical protein